MKLQRFRPFISMCLGLLCGWLIGGTVTLMARGVDAGRPSQSDTQPCPAMALDAPVSLAIVGSAFYAAGWAIDLGADSGTGVDGVQVWAYPNPGSGDPAVFLGEATYGGARSDVGAAFGEPFTNSGFLLQIVSLSPGTYRIAAFAHSTVTGTFDVRTADVTVGGPLMAIDAPAPGAWQSGPFVVSGWALDLSAASDTGVDAINIWAFPVSGGPPIFVGSGGYGAPRPDVGAIFGSQFTNAGYSTSVALPAGTPSAEYDLVVYAHSSITNTFSQSRTVRITFALRARDGRDAASTFGQ